MKNVYSLVFFVFVTVLAYAQSPQFFNYQAVIRDNTGQVIENQNVSLRVTILEGSVGGTNVYQEEHSVTTNGFGLVNIEIGNGSVVSGDFALIGWGTNSYFVQIELDETGGTSYQLMGVSQLLSVPYAMYANTSGKSDSTIWKRNINDIFYNEGNVGIGEITPTGRLVVRSDSLAAIDDVIFSVLNAGGDTVLAVYQEGVRIWVSDDTTGVKANGNRGGFAVGGFNPTKAGFTNEYLRVTPDSVRVYIKENSGAKANGSRGGFAVGGFNPSKALTDYYFNIEQTINPEIINPSEPRILWYPSKEAFLTGRVLIESIDSVGLNSMATGFESKAIGNYSQAFGYSTRAYGVNSTSIGYRSNAVGVNSYAFGANVLALDSGSYAFGNESAALAEGSFVFGTRDTASGKSSMALGYQTKASGLVSLSMGAYTEARDTLSVAMGYYTISDGIAAVSMGESTQALGYSSLALGYSTVALGDMSTSMGNETMASGESSIAMGFHSRATGLHSVAMGDSTHASIDNATAMGYKTTASGYFSTSMGYQTLAQGQSAFATGSLTQATGEASISMGIETGASGLAAMAIGSQTLASGNASVAIGMNSKAQGDASVAYGVNTNATASGSFIIGSFNEVFSPVNDISLFSELFVIGNGTDSINTHNAFTVLKTGYIGVNTNTPDKLFTVNGDARVTGDIYYGAIGFPTIYNKPDYVFLPDYKKNFDINYIEKFIKRNGHLPWLTAAEDEENGINMTRMSFETLEAVENLQLQIIQLKKENQELKTTNTKMLKRLLEIEKQLRKINKK